MGIRTSEFKIKTTKDIPTSCEIRANGLANETIIVTTKAHFFPKYKPTSRTTFTMKAISWIGFKNWLLNANMQKHPCL